MQTNRQTETFPSKVDPEISPKDQDLKIGPEDCPETINVALTSDEITFLKKLIRHDHGSPFWYTEMRRIRMILQSIAHQVQIAVKSNRPQKSILDPDFDLNTLLPEDLEEADPETEPKQKNSYQGREMPYVYERYTPESPFV